MRAMSGEIEIGRSKRARQAYSFDDIAVVPARRTRDVRDVRVSWQLDAYHVDLPVMASPMDSVMSPETAIRVGRLGGIGVLDAPGLPGEQVPAVRAQRDIPAPAAGAGHRQQESDRFTQAARPAGCGRYQRRQDCGGRTRRAAGGRWWRMHDSTVPRARVRAGRLSTGPRPGMPGTDPVHTSCVMHCSHSSRSRLQ